MLWADTAQFHAQPSPREPDPPVHDHEPYPDLPPPQRHYGLNIFLNHYLTVDNIALKENEAICIDDEVVFESGNVSGEWFSKGGPTDSPPVQFLPADGIETLEEARAAIFRGETGFIDAVYLGSFCSGAQWIEYFNVHYNEYYNDNYRMQVRVWEDLCKFYGQVICENNCVQSGSTEQQAIRFDCSAECFLYVERIPDVSDPVGTKQRNWINVSAVFEHGEKDSSFTYISDYSFKRVTESKGPDIDVTLSRFYEDKLYLVMQNKGDIGAIIDYIRTDSGSQVFYAQGNLNPGMATDVIVFLRPQLGLKAGGQTSAPQQLEVAYRATDKACQDRVDYVKVFSLDFSYPEQPVREQKLVEEEKLAKDVAVADEGEPLEIINGQKRAHYDLILEYGKQPKPNLLDLREVVGFS